jgi:two-component system CheB/CheR fusion protein
MQRVSKDGRIVEVMTTSTALMNEAGEAYAIATTERKIDVKEPAHG